MNPTSRRVSYVFLCMVPFVAILVGTPRALRIPGLYHLVGGALFAACLIAAWILVGRAIRSSSEGEQRLALAGGFLIVPFALIALFWVGLGPPWVATPPDNFMRYLVLLVSSIAVTLGFVILKESLSEAGERTYSTVGFAAAMLAGSAYLIWMSFLVGAYVANIRDGKVSSTIAALSDVLEILIDSACLLTYLATAAFAASFGRTRWLGRSATRAYVALSLIALLCLVIRGISLQSPEGATAWYAQPGFIAGIPAIPFIMPFLLGVVLLRRAGDSQR